MTTSHRLQGKIAIVTGSSAGIGRAIALRYAVEGAYIVCGDLKDTDPLSKDHDGKPTHEAINHFYPDKDKDKRRAIFVAIDVTASQQWEKIVSECVKEFGRLDIVVNNAGIGNQGIRPVSLRIHEVPEVAFDKIIGVNVKGVFLGCKYAAAQMLAQPAHPSGDRGWIINMASVLGFRGMNALTEYSASKGAVVNLTKAVALEYAGDKIHVNAIAPGFTRTAIIKPLTDAETAENPHPLVKAALDRLVSKHPFGPRLGEAEDIAGAAVFLASGDAAWVTGHTLAVDGGYLAG